METRDFELLQNVLELYRPVSKNITNKTKLYSKYFETFETHRRFQFDSNKNKLARSLCPKKSNHKIFFEEKHRKNFCNSANYSPYVRAESANFIIMLLLVRVAFFLESNRNLARLFRSM